jgi:hypothetical protein
MAGWQARTRVGGCAWAVAGAVVALTGLASLVLLVASSWGSGFSGPVQLALLVLGLALGVLGIGILLTGAEALLSRRRR